MKVILKRQEELDIEVNCDPKQLYVPKKRKRGKVDVWEFFPCS